MDNNDIDEALHRLLDNAKTDIECELAQSFNKGYLMGIAHAALYLEHMALYKEIMERIELKYY